MTTKDRKRQLARKRFERQQQRERRARRARRNKAFGVVAGIAVVGLGGTSLAFAFAGEGNDPKAAAEPSTSQSPSTPPTPTVKPGECAYSPNQGQGAKNVGTPPVKPRYKSTVAATVKTNLGGIGLNLDGKNAACTVNSFAYLASKNFFDKTHCHRMVTQGIKVLQCGDPSGTGSGGPAYKFAEENLPKPKAGAQTATYAKGVLAMANAGPGTNGSQFFIVYGDSELPPSYTVFGEITSAMDIVESVAKAGVKSGGAGGSGDGPPKKEVTIQDITITKK